MERRQRWPPVVAGHVLQFSLAQDRNAVALEGTLTEKTPSHALCPNTYGITD